MKKCSKCKLTKPLNEFYKDKSHKDGLRSMCKYCREIARGKFQKTTEGRLYQRKSHYKFKYNITLEEFDDLFESQNRKCAICGTIDPGRCRFFRLDHNHITGKTRGILCNKCNVGLGSFNDSIEVLEKALNYMKSKEI